MVGVKKSSQMMSVEKRVGRPLEKVLPELINERGLSATAEELGINSATLNYWLLKFGIRMQRIALSPGETFTITRAAY